MVRPGCKGRLVNCWPFFYCKSSDGKRQVGCLGPFCTVNASPEYLRLTLCCFLSGLSAQLGQLRSMWLLFFIYRASEAAVCWTTCLFVVYRRRENRTRTIRILGCIVIRLDDGEYWSIAGLAKYHKLPDGFRFWFLLFFLRKQSDRLTVSFFPLFSYRWREGASVRKHFLLYYSYASLCGPGNYQWGIFPFFSTKRHQRDGTETYCDRVILGALFSRRGEGPIDGLPDKYFWRFLFLSRKVSAAKKRLALLGGILMWYENEVDQVQWKILLLARYRRIGQIGRAHV